MKIETRSVLQAQMSNLNSLKLVEFISHYSRDLSAYQMATIYTLISLIKRQYSPTELTAAIQACLEAAEIGNNG